MQALARPASHSLISSEDAWMLVEEFSEVERHSLGGCEICTGNHPLRGRITVVIASLSDSLLINPFASQAALS